MRGRLVEHVRDFDFGERIELWNDIEAIQLAFFLDGAREIYERLVRLKANRYSLRMDSLLAIRLLVLIKLKSG